MPGDFDWIERGVLKNENGTVASLVSKEEAQACGNKNIVPYTEETAVYGTKNFVTWRSSASR